MKKRFEDFKLTMAMFGMYLLVQLSLLTVLLFTTTLSDEALWLRATALLVTMAISITSTWAVVRKKVSYAEVSIISLIALFTFVTVGNIIDDGFELHNLVTIALIIYSLVSFTNAMYLERTKKHE